MCHPVGQPIATFKDKRPSLSIDLEAIQKTERLFQEKLVEHGVGSPMRDPAGKPIKGKYKRLLKTNRSDRVALASSPYRTKRPDLYFQAAKDDTAMLRRFQGKGHFPVLFDSFEVPGKRLVTIQENLGPTLYDAFLSPENPRREDLRLSGMQRIFKNLLEAALVLHKEGVLHGDPKPENSNREGVLFDFSLSEEIGIGYTRGLKYSRYYRPPETVIFRKTYLSGDVWALGALFYELFAKERLISVPHTSDSVQDDINMLHAYMHRLKLQYDTRSIHKVRPDYFEKQGDEIKLKPSTISLEHLEPYLDSILKYGKEWSHFADLLEKMLRYVPKDRITVEQALSHPFFKINH